MTSPDLVLGIKWYLVFLFSTTLHEAAHAWSALKLGDDTAHRGGQVTLDPTPISGAKSSAWSSSPSYPSSSAVG